MINIQFERFFKFDSKNVKIAAVANVVLFFLGWASMYLEKKIEMDSAAIKNLGFAISQEASISDVMGSISLVRLMIASVIFGFIPILLSLQIFDHLKQEPHAGWRRIYLVLPPLVALATLISFMISGSRYSLVNFFITILCCLGSTAIMFSLLSIFVWIKDGFKSARSHD